MSTEETELTFVRCPSCRSLVPAVAVRCRMCGQELSAQQSHASESDSLEKEPESSPSQLREREEEDVEKTSVLQAQSAETEASNGTLFPFGESTEEFDFGGAFEPASEEEGGIDNFPPVREPEPKKEDSREAQEVVDEGSLEEERPKKKRRRRRRKKSSVAAELVENGNVPLDKSELEESVVPQSQEEFLEQSSVEETPKRAKARPAPVNVQEGAEGALVGWLVSYAGNPDGVATEIRSGRFFVGNRRLRDTDLVIEEKGISAPHCLIRASAGNLLHIQDLMSEKGTFVRRRGEREYKRHDEAVEVQSGDRVRLGDYEVLVCLVPFPENEQ